jgi:hypothetical protein
VFVRTTATKTLYEERLSCPKQAQFLSRFKDVWKSEQNMLFIISVFLRRCVSDIFVSRCFLDIV